MNIVVTGGSGHIGRYVVHDLVQAGHQVTSVDVVFATFSDARSHQVDLTDAGQVYQALVGARAEAVVHLGAWSFDGRVPPTRTFGDNARGTFNVFQACADLGIERVVSASTNHVYGVVKTPPAYFPIDEAHPLRPAGPYALSKVVAEQMADYFANQYDLEILSFRFMGIRSPARLDSDIERIAQNPERGIHLLWTRTDARDAALACRLALETEDIESGPYNITGRNVVLDQDSAELVKRHLLVLRSNLCHRGHLKPKGRVRSLVTANIGPVQPDFAPVTYAANLQPDDLITPIRRNRKGLSIVAHSLGIRVRNVPQRRDLNPVRIFLRPSPFHPVVMHPGFSQIQHQLSSTREVLPGSAICDRTFVHLLLPSFSEPKYAFSDASRC